MYYTWFIYSISKSMRKTVIAKLHSILTKNQTPEQHLTPSGETDLRDKNNLLLWLVITLISEMLQGSIHFLM